MSPRVLYAPLSTAAKARSIGATSFFAGTGKSLPAEATTWARKSGRGYLHVSLGQCNVALVTRRRSHIAANVAETIRDANVSTEMVAQAADLSERDLELRLNGAIQFEVSTLEKVGGFLHVPTTHFLRGVA